MLVLWKTLILTLLTMMSSPHKQSGVDAYSTGLNINAACSGLTPIHGVTSQGSPPPYSISFTEASYTAGSPVTVTIKTCTSTPFKGFLIQARRATVGSDQTTPLGSFNPATGTQQTCGGNGLVHNSADEKSEVTFDWTPTSAEGHVQFWITFVEIRVVFWEAVKSEVLLDGLIGTPIDPATLTPATVLAIECDDNSTTLSPPGGGMTTDGSDAMTTDSTGGSLTVPSRCGTSLGCVSKCSGSTCETVISWQENGDAVLYTLSSVVSSSAAYVSIGFSSDENMGADSVTGCASAADGTVVVFNGENTGRQAPTLFDDPEVTLQQSSIENNVLSCTFERPKNASSDGKRFEVTSKWIIMFARGSASISGSTVDIGYHFGDKFVTSSKYASSDTPNVGAEVPEYPLIKAHGSLMVFAWIFFASIGIVVARYYKPVWTESLLSQKVWFQIHRASMMMVFVMTLLGLVVIFLEVEDWSELIEIDEHLEYHPHMGVVVTVLTVLNPIMALFRPGPGTKNRPFFNWAHWIVGNVSHIMAVITIFFGIELQKAQSPDYLVYILAGYVAWQLLVELVLEVMQHRLWAKVCRSSKVSDETDVKPSEKEESMILTAKKVIIVVHVVVLVVFTSLTTAFVVKGDEE